MNPSTNERPAVSSVLNKLRQHRATRARRAALARDLATFDTPAAILDFAAMLDRYPDEDTAELRATVAWNRAA
ncbi:hypothetical protein M6D93_15740 [Jatrophihabitans telluris]|uniref:Uncharacterized protein n=1 Tax=Jatrophihabitans telluris TaxID=2038343 RepID=A0ABY4QVZ5_9ACTN|nr:hypothetical protein [Jatrophihabitans telluris]UQX87740.1 hypothetical protein M6D93_15740 [Jatrophihabitans telluris]